MAENLTKTCVVTPKTPTGAQSRLYKELLGRLKDRPTVNYFYAIATHPKVVADLQARGYRLEEGEVRPEDFLSTYKIDKIVMERTSEKGTAAFTVGAVDNVGNTIEYDTAEEPLNKVVAFNKTNKSFVAKVVARNEKYIINIAPKNATNQINEGAQELEKQIWDSLSMELSSCGIDLSELHKELSYFINPLEADKIAIALDNIKNATDYSKLNGSELHLLLFLGNGSTQVDRIKAKADGIAAAIAATMPPGVPYVYTNGDLAFAAKYMFDALNGVISVTPDTLSLINSTIENLQKLNGLDTGALKTHVADLATNFKANSVSYGVGEILDKLSTDYEEITNEIVNITKGIKSLRDAAGTALLQLQRERNRMEREHGVTFESLEIDKLEDSLGASIRDNQYYAGILDYLSYGEKISKKLDLLLGAIPTGGDTFTRCRDTAESIISMQNLITAYADVLEALLKEGTQNILTDDIIDEDERTNIKDSARALYNAFSNKQNRLLELRDKVVFDMATEVLGDAGVTQDIINDLVLENANSSNVFDYLFSVGRQSNALIGVMGSVIRDAQDKRDALMNDITKRIDSATVLLEKETGSSDSSWMYDSSGRFINKYDFDLYEAAYYDRKRYLAKRGMKGVILEESMQQWERENTYEVEVDVRLGIRRTERMPITSKFSKRIIKKDMLAYYKSVTGKSNAKKVPTYWIMEHQAQLVNDGVIELYNPYDNLKDGQRHYYDTIMQIKGELGTMLPHYAQQHYLAPQVTKDLQDNLADKNIVKGISKHLRDKFTITDKDHELNRDYFMMGDEESAITRGDLEGRVTKYIPVYYTSRLKTKEDRDNLLKNASSGLAHLAGVAANYKCMSDVEDLCNIIGGYVVNSSNRAKDSQGHDRIDGVLTDKVVTIQKLRDAHGSNTRTRAIVEGMLDQHLYGYTLDERDAKFKKLSKTMSIILEYSSVYNLTMNVKGAVSNLLVGEFQMIIDAMAGSAVKRLGGEADFFTFRDYVWAHDLLFKKNRGVRNTLLEFLNNNTDSYNGLLGELFDPTMDNYSKKSRKKYRSRGGNFIDKDWKFIGYGSGEYLIHLSNMLSILHNRKIKVDGKLTNMYNAFTIVKDANGVKHLEIKPNAVTLDGQPITMEYVNKLRGTIREANQNMHGSMNTEDQGVIKQRLIGRAAMHLRTWMVEHYSRRYRQSHFSAASKDMREGFYYTTFNLMKNMHSEIPMYKMLKDMSAYRRMVISQWSKLTNHQKTNVMRSLTEMTAVLTGALFGICGALDPDDYDTWLERFALYQVKRLLQDEKASVFWGIPDEGFAMARNLFPLLTTVRKTWYLIGGLTNGDVLDEVKVDDGYENKYWHNVKNRVIPFYHQWYQLLHLDDEDSIFSVFQMQYSM